MNVASDKADGIKNGFIRLIGAIFKSVLKEYYDIMRPILFNFVLEHQKDTLNELYIEWTDKKPKCIKTYFGKKVPEPIRFSILNTQIFFH